MLKSRGYVALLVFGAIVGVPVAVIAYFFLKLVTAGQKYFFTTLPGELGFQGVPPERRSLSLRYGWRRQGSTTTTLKSHG